MSPADRIAELEEERLQLRRELALEPSRQRVAALQLAFRLTPSEAIILAVLWDKGRAWIDAERLNMALPERDQADPRDLAVIPVHVCHLRQKLGADTILGMRERGYTLGAAGVYACRRVLNAAGAA